MPITTEVVSSNPEVYQIQHCVIKFVSDLQQVSGFLRAIRFSSINKTDRHGITEILLKSGVKHHRESQIELFNLKMKEFLAKLQQKLSLAYEFGEVFCLFLVIY